MMPPLKTAIDDLYRTFSRCRGNPQMEGSPLHDLDSWNKELFSKQLQDLSSEDLSLFTGKTMTTWGNLSDFKHFLPRILELIATLDPPYDIGIIFGKLEYGEWDAWEEAEKESIMHYMMALWKSLLNDHRAKARNDFVDYFLSIARVYPNFKDILEAWEIETGTTSTQHLANFIFTQGQHIFDQRHLKGIDKKPEVMRMLQEWLLSDKIIGRLQQAFFDCRDEKKCETISWAEKILTDENQNRALGNNQR